MGILIGIVIGSILSLLIYGAIRFSTRKERIPAKIIDDAQFGKIKSFDKRWEKDGKEWIQDHEIELAGFSSNEPTQNQRTCFLFVVKHFLAIKEKMLKEVYSLATTYKLDWQESDFSITFLSLDDFEKPTFGFTVAAPKFDKSFAFEISIDFEEMEITEIEQIH